MCVCAFEALFRDRGQACIIFGSVVFMLVTETSKKFTGFSLFACPCASMISSLLPVCVACMKQS